MKYAFPAIFYPDEGGFSVRFFDADWFTCGDDMAEAIEMAEDVLNLSLWDLEEDGKEIPKASKLDDVKLEANQTVRMIYADTELYARKVKEQLERESIEAAKNPIKAVRESRNWTVEEFADFLGAPQETIQEWNSGKTQPPTWISNLIIEKVQSAN